MATNLFIPPDQIVTPDYTIRSFRPGDGAALAEATRESYDHLKTFMDWARPDPSVAETELLTRSMRGRYLLRTDFTLGIFAPDDATVLGGTGYHLRGRALETKYAEIGMWIRGDRAHRGLGTRALVTLLEWGFGGWEWERLEWRCDSRNGASRRVAEKAGMTQDALLRGDSTPGGVRRGTYVYSALRGEWARPTRLL